MIRYVPAVVEHQIEIRARVDLRHTAIAEHRMLVYFIARAVRTLVAREFGTHGGTLFSRFRRNKILRKPSAVIASLFAIPFIIPSFYFFQMPCPTAEIARLGQRNSRLHQSAAA